MFAVTGPVDHVSDSEGPYAIANGHELLATVTEYRLHVDGDHQPLSPPCAWTTPLAAA